MLQISKMENVVRVKDALQANMKDKRYIDELSLDWEGSVMMLQLQKVLQ